MPPSSLHAFLRLYPIWESCLPETPADLESSSALVFRGGGYQSLRAFCRIECRRVVDESTVLEPGGIGVRPVFNLYEDRVQCE